MQKRILYNPDDDLPLEFERLPLPKPILKPKLIDVLKERRRLTFRSKIAKALNSDYINGKFELQSWKNIGLADFKILTLKDIKFDAGIVESHYIKHNKIFKNINEVLEYELAIKNFISIYFENQSSTNIIIPEINSVSKTFNLKLYGVSSGKLAILSYEDELNRWKFKSYYKLSPVIPDLAKILYKHVHNYIEFHLDLRTCGLFSDPITLSHIVKKIDKAKGLRNHLENRTLNEYWIQVITNKRGSIENLT